MYMTLSHSLLDTKTNMLPDPMVTSTEGGMNVALKSDQNGGGKRKTKGKKSRKAKNTRKGKSRKVKKGKK